MTNTPPAPLDLDAIRRKLTALSPVKWGMNIAGTLTNEPEQRVGLTMDISEVPIVRELPADVAALVAEVERLRAFNNEVVSFMTSFINDWKNDWKNDRIPDTYETNVLNMRIHALLEVIHD